MKEAGRKSCFFLHIGWRLAGLPKGGGGGTAYPAPAPVDRHDPTRPCVRSEALNGILPNRPICAHSAEE
ncbi:hypothetical protein [Treponema endosymbiont of Eucomonympha sp.]|uniref:hypothetical protein n=1 Tax=Treponema endosymbiont of Eucomonympha sp. TaxID=1580831 RepID=UPI0007516667|nr:hypothetical protein [Treponema endosymbiont of Eucomonympha sp.]